MCIRADEADVALVERVAELEDENAKLKSEIQRLTEQSAD